MMFGQRRLCKSQKRFTPQNVLSPPSTRDCAIVWRPAGEKYFPFQMRFAFVLFTGSSYLALLCRISMIPSRTCAVD